jgi:hypothetical protein
VNNGVKIAVYGHKATQPGGTSDCDREVYAVFLNSIIGRCRLPPSHEIWSFISSEK